MNQTPIYIIIGVVMLSFLLLSPWRVWVLIIGIFFVAVTGCRYLMHVARQED